MDAVSLFRDQVKAAHEFLEMTMNDVTPEQAHWAPPGVANPLGATYAHVTAGEDGFVSGMLKGGAPLLATTWVGRLGLSEPPPADASWGSWARGVRVDLAAVREYAHAIYASTDEYLASLADSDLARPIDLSAVGFGQQTLAWVISNGIVGHVMAHWGEIACLKGLQGGKGFPI